MKIQNDDCFIKSLLKNTKNLVKETDNYNNYINKDNSFFSNQLPIINQRKYLSGKKFKKDKILIKNQKFLNSIRMEKNELKNMPKLFQNFSSEELIPNLFSSSQIENKKEKVRKLLSPFTFKKIKKLSDIPLSFKKSNSNNILATFDNYEKDFFWDIDYSNLKYDENEIFRNKSKYDNLIKEKIKYFKKEKNENQTYLLEKKFNYKENKIINLSLTSMTIQFEDFATNETSDNLKINFPFALLPLFYYRGIETFQKLLTTILKFENNYKKITVDEEAIYIYLNNLKDFEEDYVNEFENKIYFLNNNEEKEKETKQKKSSSKKEIPIVDKTRKNRPISLRPQILKRNKFFLRFNYFIFFWTTNNKTFKVTITLPLIKLNIEDNNILVQLFANYEFLFFLYSKNFLNWDFYIIKYLSSFKKFRYILKKLGSHNAISFKSIFLKEPRIKINTFSEEILLNIHTDEYNRNQIIKFQSFNLKVNLLDNFHLYENEYHIHFTFFHFIKLVEIAKYASKILFLTKFLDIKDYNNTLDFNYENYDALDIKSWMNNIEKFTPDYFQNNQFKEKKYREFQIYSKIIRIQFIKPLMTLIRFENKNEVSKSCEIENELEYELVTSITNGTAENFNRLLNLCLEKMHSPHQHLSFTFTSPLKKISSTIEKEKLKEIKECDNANEEDLQFLNKNSDSPNQHIHPKKNSKIHFHNRHISHPIIKINKFIINKHNN